MTNPLTTVMPRRRPTTYTARPGFQPVTQIPEQPTPDRREQPAPPPAPPARRTSPAGKSPAVPSPTAAAPQIVIPEQNTPVDIAEQPDDPLGDTSAAREVDPDTLDVDDQDVDQGQQDGGELDIDEMDIEPASLVEFLYPPSEDPFDVTMVLGAPGIAVGTRLTPPVLSDLIAQLECIRDEQLLAMGLAPADPGLAGPPPTSTTAADAADPGEDDEDEQDSISRRAADPLGLRQLRGRSQRTTVLIGAGIAVLLVLSVLWNTFAR